MEILATKIKQWGSDIGFSSIKIADVDQSAAKSSYLAWIDANFHADMHYMQNNIDLRFDLTKIHPNTKRVICVSLDYLPQNAAFSTLLKPEKAYISRYALGRDYHKVMKNKLKKLGELIAKEVSVNYRPFVDSAPVLEHNLAVKSGIGWQGKHSLILTNTGSWFFLGELFVDLPLPIDLAIDDGCNKCIACIKSCPTGAIVAPYVIDSNRCISYQTIENRNIIPLELRSLMGNRVYGCDDCQLVCPYNSGANLTKESDFAVKDRFKDLDLIAAFSWSEDDFLKIMQGSPIRRIGYITWLRNVAVALGNAPFSVEILKILKQRKEQNLADILNIHIDWALEQQMIKSKVDFVPSKQITRILNVVKKGSPRDL